MSGLEPQPSRQLYLNSRNASYVQDPTRNSRLSFNLNEPIVCPKGHEFYASIVSAEIPNTLYSINPGDTIVFNWYKGGVLAGSITYTCANNVATVPAAANALLVIPAGNYSGTTNSTVLAGYLSKTAFAFDGITITFTTTYDTATSRFRIAWTSTNATNTTATAIANINTNGSANSGQAIITLASLTGLVVGASVSGQSQIPANSYITAINIGANQITINNNLSATLATALPLTFSFGAGTPYLQLTSITNAVVGATISGTNIPANAIISSINSTDRTILLNTSLTATVAPGTTITFAYSYSLAINNTLLGFNIANTSATALATPIVAATLPRLFPNYILIGSNLNSYNQAVGQSLIPALAKITIDVPFNSWIYFRNWFLYTTRITNREIFNLEITLYDEFGQLLNLNSGHFSFTIQIDTKQMITNSLGTGNF